MCDYAGGGLLVSRLAPGRSYQVKARRATVNAAYMNVEVPSTRGPAYQVDAGVNLVPINGLASVDRPWSRYVVIGGGKTGIDAILFLLARGVDPASVSWVVPNDAWFYDRENLQPRNVIDGGKEQLMAGLASESVEGFLTHLEARGRLLRLDREVWPTKYRCATVTKGELAHLRRVEDVIRMGRVRRISTEEIELVEGAVLTGADTLHVDCTADGLAKRPEVSIFAGAAITLQPAVMCQQVFSAALIAAVELRCADDGEKNKLLTPVPHPEYPEDALVGLAQTMLNLDGCGARMPLWLRGKRLSMIHHPGLCSFLSHAVYMKRHLKRGAEKLRILGQREG